MGARSERQPITSCHYFLPSTQKHETLRNIFLAQVKMWSGDSTEFRIPYGKRKQLVRSETIWAPTRIETESFLCCLSCRWATGSWGEAVSTAGCVGHHTQREKQKQGKAKAGTFALKININPAKDETNLPLQCTASQKCNGECLSRKTDSPEQCTWAWNLCSPSSQNVSHVDKCHC